MGIRLGYQIPNFTYGGPVADLFPTVVAQAREAEAAGFDAVLVMDHFYQLPGIGRPDEPMLESYTALGALATATERVQLSTLVTGNTYRQPDLAGQGGDHAGRGQRWPCGAGDRRRLVRAGAPAARVRVRHVHRAVRPARRGAADHRADAARPAPQRGRRVVPRRERGQRAPHPRRPADHARRRRGEEDVRARRALRRPPQHHLRPRGPSPEAGGARSALRRGRPGPLEHRDQHARLADGGRGRRQGPPAAARPPAQDRREPGRDVGARSTAPPPPASSPGPRTTWPRTSSGGCSTRVSRGSS